MTNVEDLEQQLDDFERRLNELEDTVTGRAPSDGLERRLDELEQKVEGRRGLEGDIESLEREVEDLKSSFKRL